MDKIAIISDVHANFTALSAVLMDIHSRNISRIFCLGDSVTKCANPDKVIDLLRDNCEVILLGNCDEAIASDRAIERKFWSRVKIGEERAKFLKNLPVMYEFYISGRLVRLFHASPISLSHIYNPMFSNIGNKYSANELQNPMCLFQNTDFIKRTISDPVPDIVGYGHIHTPNIVRYKNKLLFNPGSVGIPIEMLNSGDLNDKTNSFSTMASYTILEGNLNSKNIYAFSATLVRIPYDLSSEIHDIELSDMPGKEQIAFNLKTASPNY